MICPFCSAQETRVIDSRLSNEGEQVRRRRECIACKERFTTYEKAELTLPRVVKSDGKREPFSEEKLRSGMLRALEKRPVQIDRIEKALVTIKKKLRAMGERELEAKVIGETVMDELNGLDHVAYVRFASVYRSFEDISEFQEAIDRIKRSEATVKSQRRNKNEQSAD